MPKFKIVKIYKYTTEAIIEAECYDDAVRKVYDVDGEVNHDDWLSDYDVMEISDE